VCPPEDRFASPAAKRRLALSLPQEAYSIKVGVAASKARYNLSSQKGVLPLLYRLVESEKKCNKKKNSILTSPSNVEKG